VSSSHNSVIDAIEDSLSKPDLHPRAREVLERRLEQIRKREYNRSEFVKEIKPVKLYKTREVAALLNCSIRKVQYMVKLGSLKALRNQGLIRIPGEEIVRFLEKP